MQKQCPNCNKIYNFDSQPIFCPHIAFPKPCKKHSRVHCGNLECQNQADLFEIDSRKKKEA